MRDIKYYDMAVPRLGILHQREPPSEMERAPVLRELRVAILGLGDSNNTLQNIEVWYLVEESEASYTVIKMGRHRVLLRPSKSSPLD